MKAILFIPALCLVAANDYAKATPVANGLERTLVASNPLIQNPVSATVDVHGTIYVTETTRRKAADLDIREFAGHGWIPHDVALTSVEEKRAFFQRELTPDRFKGHRSLKDHNNDGVVDIKDLTALTEKIIRLRDTTGDGVMDTRNIFAEDFNTEVTGIAAGVFAWRGDIYATIAPDLWKLRDTRGDGIADQRQSLAHGFAVHIAYAGHDMHGLTWGPDGRVYWSIGDKGTNVTTPDGKNHYAPHEGAVLRCYPDGSGFEIFARGLRNPQEIAFNQYGDLFSVDNDADFKGERERFLHITEGSDTGWRIYYQYRGSDYNPWMAENMWEISGPHQPAYITPTTANYTDGPAGFAFNPGTALNERYRHAFFVTEFPKGNLRAFKVQPKGATFEMIDEHIVDNGPMNVGVQFGPDGALYTADWSGGYALNEKGAIWKYDDPTVATTPIRREVANLLRQGPANTSTADLIEQLAHPDQRIRLDAQWELAARKATTKFHQVILDPASDQLAVIHALWGLSQIGEFSEIAFHHLITSADPEFRAQAAKHAGETSDAIVPALVLLLADTSPRVRFHAATAIWKLGMTEALDATLAMLAENNDEDAYLRQAGALALSGMDIDQVAAKSIHHENPAVRLAAAVAFRRANSPHAATLLLDEDPQVIAEAARAIYDEPAIYYAFPNLATVLSLKPDATPPAIRRSIAANRYLGDLASAAGLAEYAIDTTRPADLRVAALQVLTTWPTEFSTDPVDGRHHPFKAAEVGYARAALAKHIAALQQDPETTIATAAAEAAKALNLIADEATLATQALDTNLPPGTRLRSLEALSPMRSERFKTTATALLADESAAVRSGTAMLFADIEPVAVTTYAIEAVKKSSDIPERQQALQILAKSDDPAAKSLIRAIVETAAANPTEAASGYDSAILLELVEITGSPAITEKLASLGPLGPFLASLHGGDPILGERLFTEHLAAQCTACHRIGDAGSNVGPPLTHVGRQSREYILESLVLPQAAITPGYGIMSVTKSDASTLTGALKEEAESILTLILPDHSEVTIPLAEITSRTNPVSTMPPMVGILNPRELRDLTAYLASLK
jgi:putative membrane-bound dehydrogenase-like protein